MLDPLAGLMLTKAQYASLASLEAYREPRFPSWIDWNKLQMRAAGTVLKAGGRLEPWTIDIEAFYQWCERVGTTPCIDELRTFCQTPGAKRPG
jgi:hypothetical protein